MKIIGLVLAVFLLKTNLCAAEENLKIVIQENNVFLEKLLPTILQEAQLTATFLNIPSERTLLELNIGKIDANGLRLNVLEDLYPNIIRMEEPIEHINFIAITNNKDIEIQNWSDLIDLKVGYPRGWKIFDLNVPKNASVMKTKNQIQLFKMLNANRLDVVLLSTPIANTLLKEIEVPNVHFHKPPLHKNASIFVFP